MTSGTSTPIHHLTHGRSQTSMMSEIEEQFLHAVEFGDVMEVKSLLESYPNLNVDCTDALGRTPLRLAVKNENKELVEILLCLSNPDNMQEAVLQAIDSGYTNIAEVALRHPRYLETANKLKRMGDTDGFFKPERGSQFPSYVTPLNLAAQKNQYVIVQLLLLRGETISKPHKFGCSCQECINKNKFDQLRSAKYRLNTYKGLASEAYISLYSKDPFLTAFDLANELRKLAQSEVFFRNEYTELANQVSEYVVKLLDRVWTQRELSAVLDKTGLPAEDRFDSLARFKLAVDNKEKQFVSHPNCQQRIERCWYEGMGKIDRANWPQRFGFLFLGILIYPFLIVCFFLAPNSKIGRWLTVPVVKFISHTVSFFAFLVLIIITSVESMSSLSNTITLASKLPAVHARYIEFLNNSDVCMCGSDFPLRSRDATVTEILITIWVIAMLVQECQELWDSGHEVHFSDYFNLMDFLLISVYVANFTLRFWTLYKTEESARGLASEDLSADPVRTETYVYWLNADRRFWSSTDPINMAEGLFAMANILSFTRITYLLSANESLGPLQISLGRMMNDILKFFALAIILIIAFMVALRNLFWYYNSRHNIELDADKIAEPEAVEWYGSELATFRTVFWSVYGRGPVRAVSLGAYNNTMTETIGQAIDGMYNITMIIVLLNILVAMMTRSFEKIQEDADVEWKYARSALYMDYITEGRVLPVPLNVIEVPYSLIRYCVALLLERKHENDDSPHQTFLVPGELGSLTSPRRDNSRQNRILEESGHCPAPTGTPHFLSRNRGKSTKSLTLYQGVIQCIIQRYIYDVQRENEITGNADDVKHHFECMRYEVLTQYRVKEESISMAMGAVHSVAQHLTSATGKKLPDYEIRRLHHHSSTLDEFYNSFDSDETNVYSGYSSPQPQVFHDGRHSNVLCDVYEEPDSFVKEESVKSNNVHENDAFIGDEMKEDEEETDHQTTTQNHVTTGQNGFVKFADRRSESVDKTSDNDIKQITDHMSQPSRQDKTSDISDRVSLRRQHFMKSLKSKIMKDTTQEPNIKSDSPENPPSHTVDDNDNDDDDEGNDDETEEGKRRTKM